MVYFVFMATEATLLDMPSRIPEVAEMYSSILFDLLVVLAMVFGVMPRVPPREVATGRRNGFDWGSDWISA